MDRIRTGHDSRRDDRLTIEVTVLGIRRSDTDRFIGQVDVKRILVGFRVDGDRANPHVPTSTDDGDGDFAAIGN